MYISEPQFYGGADGGGYADTGNEVAMCLWRLGDRADLIGSKAMQASAGLVHIQCDLLLCVCVCVSVIRTCRSISIGLRLKCIVKHEPTVIENIHYR